MRAVKLSSAVTALVDGLTGRSYSLAEARELASQTDNGLLRWKYFLETLIWALL